MSRGNRINDSANNGHLNGFAKNGQANGYLANGHDTSAASQIFGSANYDSDTTTMESEAAWIGRRPRVLFLSYRFPFPLIGGDRIKSYYLVRHLSAIADVDLIALDEGRS